MDSLYVKNIRFQTSNNQYFELEVKFVHLNLIGCISPRGKSLVGCKNNREGLAWWVQILLLGRGTSTSKYCIWYYLVTLQCEDLKAELKFLLGSDTLTSYVSAEAIMSCIGSFSLFAFALTEWIFPAPGEWVYSSTSSCTLANEFILWSHFSCKL